MKKMKIKKAVSRRFKVTKTGKVLRRSQNIRHIRKNKSKKQIRRNKVPKQVKGKFAIKIKKMLGRA